MPTGVKAVWEIRVIPVSRAAVMQLAAAAGIPMLAVVATPISLADILK